MNPHAPAQQDPAKPKRRKWTRRSAAKKVYEEMENLGFKDQRELWGLLLPHIPEQQRTQFALEMVKRIWKPED